MSLALVIAGALTIGGALGVVVSRAPVHSVIALIVNFIGLAGLYLSLNAEFLAVVQVIVYAGAVMILFLFVIALLTVQREPANVGKQGLVGQLPIKVIGAALFAVLIMVTAIQFDSGAAAQVADDFGTVRALGNELFITHVFPFEIAALVLMVALVGVVVLVGRRPEKGRE